MKKPVKPSVPPSQVSGRAPPVDGWPVPQPGDVLSYAYLWSHEADAGREDGRKDRPVAVVVAAQTTDRQVQLLVVPITHREPNALQPAIRLPQWVKRDLGLDENPSWIILSELNRFIWPGPDIRIAGSGDDPFYGAIPEGLFVELRDSIVKLATGNKLRMIRRTE